MSLFGKSKIKSRELSPQEAAQSLAETLNIRASVACDLALADGQQLPRTVTDLIDRRMDEMEIRMQQLMMQQLRIIARVTSGNQALAEMAGMEASGENTLVDAHLSTQGEVDYSGNVFLAGQGALQQPAISKSDYRQLMTSARPPAARLLGRRPHDED